MIFNAYVVLLELWTIFVCIWPCDFCHLLRYWDTIKIKDSTTNFSQKSNYITHCWRLKSSWWRCHWRRYSWCLWSAISISLTSSRRIILSLLWRSIPNTDFRTFHRPKQGWILQDPWTTLPWTSWIRCQPDALLQVRKPVLRIGLVREPYVKDQRSLIYLYLRGSNPSRTLEPRRSSGVHLFCFCGGVSQINSLCIKLQCGSQDMHTSTVCRQNKSRGLYGKHDGIELSLEISYVRFFPFLMFVFFGRLFVKQCRVEETVRKVTPSTKYQGIDQRWSLGIAQEAGWTRHRGALIWGNKMVWHSTACKICGGPKKYQSRTKWLSRMLDFLCSVSMVDSHVIIAGCTQNYTDEVSSKFAFMQVVSEWQSKMSDCTKPKR